MFENPYSPVFGGKPSLFFGRQLILARFDLAMIDHGSDDRALFITSARGSGKTALLEQLSQRAGKRGWKVIDLGPEHTVSSLIHALVPHDSETKTIDPQVSVSILGTGGSIGGVSTSRTTSITRENLTEVLLNACRNSERGIFVNIDEIQKVSLDDCSEICNAFQMASRKGYDVMLAIAGLPYSHDEVIHHKGCTYMRRAAHEELGLLSREETESAFLFSLKRTKGISADGPALAKMVEASFGHPYLIQLIGYYLVTFINQTCQDEKHAVSGDEAEEAISIAVSAYERRALDPLLAEMTSLERLYISGMAAVLDETLCARTSEIAAVLQKDASSLCRVRDSLIRNGVIVAPERGMVRFAIPYLRTYAERSPSLNSNLQLIESWGV